MSAAKPNANIVVREYRGRPYHEAKFRHHVLGEPGVAHKNGSGVSAPGM